MKISNLGAGEFDRYGLGYGWYIIGKWYNFAEN